MVVEVDDVVMREVGVVVVVLSFSSFELIEVFVLIVLFVWMMM